MPRDTSSETPQVQRWTRSSRQLVGASLALATMLGCAESHEASLEAGADIDGAIHADARASIDASARDAARASGDGGARTDAPLDPASIGQVAESCGAPDQGLTPVDCTAAGDTRAACVFGNHCFCSPGFACERPSAFEPECDPGVICVRTE